MNDTRFKRPESVLVVVYTAAGEVLVLKRADHPDFWQSVTGSLQRDESPADAASRELAEETGLAGNIVDARRTFEFEILEQWRYRYAPGVTHNREHLFSLAFKERMAVRLNPREHLESAWLPRGRAAAAVWSWTNREAILDVVLG